MTPATCAAVGGWGGVQLLLDVIHLASGVRGGRGGEREKEEEEKRRWGGGRDGGEEKQMRR